MYPGTWAAEQTGVKAPAKGVLVAGSQAKAKKFAGLTRQGEDYNLLVGPLLGSVVVDRDTAGLDISRLLDPRDVAVTG